MKIVLKSISQDVDLANPLKGASNYLILNVETEKGVSEVRVPISQETVQELVKAIHVVGGSTGQPVGSDEEEQLAQEESQHDPIPDDLEGATEFGGDPDEEQDEEQEEQEEEEGPENEERVRSL